MVCPIELTVNMFGDKWKVLILRNLLLQGRQRFSELGKGINGISQKMLTQQLRRLEGDGLVSRTVYPQVPPRVEYAVTDRGESLRPILMAMHAWGTQYMLETDVNPEVAQSSQNGSAR